jgi:hypothetical protein
MRTIRRQARVSKDHTLVVRLPDDVEEESLAEVIVRLPLADGHARDSGKSLSGFLASLPRRRRRIIGKGEIDRQLAIERKSWD